MQASIETLLQSATIYYTSCFHWLVLAQVQIHTSVRKSYINPDCPFSWSWYFTLLSCQYASLELCQMVKPSIQHSHPLHAVICQLCRAKKRARVWTSLSVFFPSLPTISITFRVNNPAQHLHGRLCYVCCYLQMLTIWPPEQPSTHCITLAYGIGGFWKI